MNKHFDTLLKLGIIIILIVAATTTQRYIFYNFVHWSVFISSIYFAYKSKQQIGIYEIRYLLIFFCAIAILFNPFIPFNFSKNTWTIIDIIAFLFIVIDLNWKGYIQSLPTKNKLVYILVKRCIWILVGTVVGAVVFAYMVNVNPYDEFLLITKSATANGFITKAEEYQDGSSETGTNIYYEYHFTTPDGKIITDKSSELGGIEDFKDESIPIKVEYLPNNPKVNRVKDATNQCASIGEFIWRRILICGGILVWICYIGFTLIKDAIQRFLISSKELTTNIERPNSGQRSL